MENEDPQKPTVTEVDVESERYQKDRAALLAAASAAAAFADWVESGLSIEEERPILTYDPIHFSAYELCSALANFGVAYEEPVFEGECDDDDCRCHLNGDGSLVRSGELLLDTIGEAICKAFDVPKGEAPTGQAVVVREAIFEALGYTLGSA